MTFLSSRMPGILSKWIIAAWLAFCSTLQTCELGNRISSFVMETGIVTGPGKKKKERVKWSKAHFLPMTFSTTSRSRLMLGIWSNSSQADSCALFKTQHTWRLGESGSSGRRLTGMATGPGNNPSVCFYKWLWQKQWQQNRNSRVAWQSVCAFTSVFFCFIA